MENKKINLLNLQEEEEIDDSISENLIHLRNAMREDDSDKNIVIRAEFASNLALLYWKKENYNETRKYFLMALGEYDKIHDDYKKASVAGAIASFYLQYNQIFQARRYYLDAYNYWKDKPYLNEKIICLQNLGLIALKDDDVEQAAEYVLEAMHMSMQLQDENQFSLSIQILLEYYEEMEMYDLVKELKMKALEFWETMGLIDRIFKTSIDLGVLSQILEQYDEALVFFKKAFNVGYRSGNLPNMYFAQGFIGEVYFKQKKIEKAKSTYIETYKLGLYIELLAKKENKTIDEVKINSNQMKTVLLSLGISIEEIDSYAKSVEEEIEKK